MRIATYFSPLSGVQNPTGVTKHAIGMLRNLQTRSEVSLQLLAGREAYHVQQSSLPQPLAQMCVRFHPGGESWMRRAQFLSNVLPIDRWADDAEWVYCPKEQPVAVQHARLAVTVHDVLTFEPTVEGMTRNKRMRNRVAWQVIMSGILARADLIATVSQFTRNRIIELVKPRHPERIAVIGNGVEELFFRDEVPQDALVLQRFNVAPRNYLIAVGGMNRRKGGDILLDLAGRIRTAKLDLPILVCGLSHEAELLEQLQDRQSDDPQFPLRLCGYVSDEDLASLYTHSTALLFPSRYEGFGIPVLEAMAAGAPVICSNAAALPETAGSAALVLERCDSDELFDAVRDLHRLPHHRDELIAAGRAHSAAFTWARCAQRLLDAMNQN